MRSSVKPCVWCGSPDSYRNQEAVLWEESDTNRAKRLSKRLSNDLDYKPSGLHVREKRCRNATERRGGVTPFNLLPIANADSQSSSGANGHGAGTPLKLADWWTRYICPPGGVILDPFCGAGTMGIAAVQNGCEFIGIEKVQEYCEISERRISEAAQQKVMAL